MIWIDTFWTEISHEIDPLPRTDTHLSPADFAIAGFTRRSL
jgi:hypothetical protein